MFFLSSLSRKRRRISRIHWLFKQNSRSYWHFPAWSCFILGNFQIARTTFSGLVYFYRKLLFEHIRSSQSTPLLIGPFHEQPLHICIFGLGSKFKGLVKSVCAAKLLAASSSTAKEILEPYIVCLTESLFYEADGRFFHATNLRCFRLIFTRSTRLFVSTWIISETSIRWVMPPISYIVLETRVLLILNQKSRISFMQTLGRNNSSVQTTVWSSIKVSEIHPISLWQV